MNKFMLNALILLFVAALVLCDDSNENSSEDFLEHVESKHLKKFLKDRKEIVKRGLTKIEEQCPGVTQKLKEALKSFGLCGETADESLSVCAYIQKYTLICSQPILQVIEDCLPQKSRGLPILIIKSVLSLADYLCKLDGELIFELFNPCLWEDSSTEKLAECDKKIFSNFGQFKSEAPSIQNICNTDLRCIREQIGPNCKKARTKNVAVGLYEALLRPCSDINKN